MDPRLEVCRSFLQKQKADLLEELKRWLGSSATMPVFRKLKALGYRSSYSPRGKYYTLANLPRFDERGLWSCGAAWFSRDGNLLATCQRLVEDAEAGLTASELQALLSVEVKEPVLQLYRRKRIDRQALGGVYVYFSREPGRRREQRLRREGRAAARESEESPLGRGRAPELQAAIIPFYSFV